MAIYNLTNLTNSTNVGELALFANQVSDGILFGFMLIALFVILLLALSRYEFADNLLTSSFVLFVLSGVLAFGGFVSIMFPLGFLLILSLTGLYTYMSRQ